MKSLGVNVFLTDLMCLEAESLAVVSQIQKLKEKFLVQLLNLQAVATGAEFLILCFLLGILFALHVSKVKGMF